jgi:hypothetical protein
MRAYLIGAAVVVVVVGGGWLVFAFALGGSLHSGADAWTRSAACVRRHPALADDSKLAAKYVSSGLRPLGITWRGVRAVGLFSDSLAPESVDRADARIVSTLQRHGVSPTEIGARLEHQDNLSLFYVDTTPSIAAQKAIGSCVYLVHYNRIASALGIDISPHAELPFVPGHRHHDRD